MKKILQAENIIKTYGKKEYEVNVLKSVSMDVYEGDFIAIMGPSGSGKTTLLNILSTIDSPNSGQVYLNNHELVGMDNKALSKLRKEEIGFIFQDYNLLDSMSLQDNIALPLALGGYKAKEIIEMVDKYSSLFGLTDHLKKYPYQLSGGQKQRGASARALVGNPTVLFADEPTGALDSVSSKVLMESLQHVNKVLNSTIIMVTHDAFSASYAKKVYFLKDGQIVGQVNRYGDRSDFYDDIMKNVSTLGSEN